MTPILRRNAPRLPLPRIDEEPVPDEDSTPTTLWNENLQPELFQNRSPTNTSASLQPQLPQTHLPDGVDCNTENSFYDDY